MHVEALSKQYSMTEIYLYYFCVSIYIYMQSFIVSVYFKNRAMFYFLWGGGKFTETCTVFSTVEKLVS